LKSEMATLKSKAWLRSSNPIPMNACFPAPRVIRTPIRIPTQLHLNSLHAPPHRVPITQLREVVPHGYRQVQNPTPAQPPPLLRPMGSPHPCTCSIPIRPLPPLARPMGESPAQPSGANPVTLQPSSTVIITDLQEDLRHEHRPNRSLANEIPRGIGLRVQGRGAYDRRNGSLSFRSLFERVWVNLWGEMGIGEGWGDWARGRLRGAPLGRKEGSHPDP